MKRKKSNLDEMQEEKLLKVEHNGCWLAFWGLLAVMIIQGIAFGNRDFRTLAGEWIVFMALAVYLAVSCVRLGIWDRRLRMNAKTNFMVSVIAALALGGITAITVFRNGQQPAGTITAALITAAVTFVLCFAALTVSMKMTDKRRKQLEEEPADADKM